MQPQEVLAKLARVRQAQARAMQRFAEAQARVAQLEARLPDLSAFQHISRTSPVQNQEAQSADSSDQSFLPASGDLELQESFVPPPQVDADATERLNVLREKQPASCPDQIASGPEASATDETEKISMLRSSEEQV
ncbi:MAG TPA: hypothetical protein VFV38_11210 [Ktedonobacteraceae bacterium]|nr:hypothetical protein [Ktedonobacteraceae bacterium]